MPTLIVSEQYSSHIILDVNRPAGGVEMYVISCSTGRSPCSGNYATITINNIEDVKNTLNYTNLVPDTTYQFHGVASSYGKQSVAHVTSGQTRESGK